MSLCTVLLLLWAILYNGFTAGPTEEKPKPPEVSPRQRGAGELCLVETIPSDTLAAISRLVAGGYADGFSVAGRFDGHLGLWRLELSCSALRGGCIARGGGWDALANHLEAHLHLQLQPGPNIEELRLEDDWCGKSWAVEQLCLERLCRVCQSWCSVQDNASDSCRLHPGLA